MTIVRITVINLRNTFYIANPNFTIFEHSMTVLR